MKNLKEYHKSYHLLWTDFVPGMRAPPWSGVKTVPGYKAGFLTQGFVSPKAQFLTLHYTFS